MGDCGHFSLPPFRFPLSAVNEPLLNGGFRELAVENRSGRLIRTRFWDEMSTLNGTINSAGLPEWSAELSSLFWANLQYSMKMMKSRFSLKERDSNVSSCICLDLEKKVIKDRIKLPNCHKASEILESLREVEDDGLSLLLEVIVVAFDELACVRNKENSLKLYKWRPRFCKRASFTSFAYRKAIAHCS
jgi:hypothetical protein